MVDFLLDLLLGEGRGGFGGVVVIGDLRGAVTAHGVAAIAHGHLREHLGAVGVQALQQFYGGALEGLRSFQGLLAVQGVDRVHQYVWVESPGVD